MRNGGGGPAVASVGGLPVMGEMALLSPVERIGETAGVVWRYLHVSGPVPLTTLARDVDRPRDLLMQALGWLAREGKLDMIETKRKKSIALKA